MSLTSINVLNTITKRGVKRTEGSKRKVHVYSVRNYFLFSRNVFKRFIIYIYKREGPSPLIKRWCSIWTIEKRFLIQYLSFFLIEMLLLWTVYYETGLLVPIVWDTLNLTIIHGVLHYSTQPVKWRDRKKKPWLLGRIRKLLWSVWFNSL